MQVVDASALFELLGAGPRANAVRRELATDDDHFAPELIDVEVGAVIQAHERRGDLDSTAAELALDLLVEWPAQRVSHRPLLDRAWALRHNIRFSDATYVALAERLGARLITLDTRLARATGPTCPVVIPA
ncbi:MAG: type II toxin-antitoxin system VapC family toxin [Actinomycetota bacterium]